MFESGKFVPWDTWSASIFCSDELGIGDGELSFANVLGLDRSAIGGPNYTYDIDAGNGMFWEVKKPVGNEIRSGVFGAVDMEFTKDIARQIRIFDETLKFLGHETFTLIYDLTDGIVNPTLLSSYVSSEVDKILDGSEVSHGRLFGSTRNNFGMLQMIKMLSNIFLVKCKPVNVSINGVDAKISASDAAKFVCSLGLKVDDFELDLDEIDVLKMTLSDSVFADPSLFERRWEEVSDPNRVFGHVNGVVLVNEFGFVVVKREDYRKYLTFSRISQGRLRYKIPKDLLK